MIKFREAVENFASRSPSRLAIIVFAGIIAVFTLLFSLPVVASNGQATPFVDALFTAVSMVCVAGLTTVDMATHWSPLGNGLVFLATQIGALGVLTLASILGSIIAGRLGLRAKLMAASDSNPLRLHAGPVPETQAIRLGEIGGLLTTIAISTLVIELGVALSLLPSVLAAGYSWGESLWYSLMYSSMAFTNTGVTANVEGLTPFAGNYFFLFMLMFAVTLGSVGFPVLFSLWQRFKKGEAFSLHVKLTVLTWGALWVLGLVVFFILESVSMRTVLGLGLGDQLFQSGFMSTMARSGGFATIPTVDLQSSSLFITDVLMFIGGGSASTAGGIKVTTFAVLLLAAFTEARGSSSIEVFRRNIPDDVLRLAVSVLLWGALTVGGATLLLLATTQASFEHILFEVISAFGTVGLSTGLTAELHDFGVYLLALVMFMGRVGTVTLAAALAVTQHRQLYNRPEERPIVG